jgi:hypothetical protein
MLDDMCCTLPIPKKFYRPLPPIEPVPTLAVVPLAPSVEVVVLAPVIPTELLLTLPELIELLPEPVFEDEDVPPALPAFPEPVFPLPVLLEAAVLFELEPVPLCEPMFPVDPDESEDELAPCASPVSEEALLPPATLKPAEADPSPAPTLELPEVSPPEAPVLFEPPAAVALVFVACGADLVCKATDVPRARPITKNTTAVATVDTIRRRRELTLFPIVIT